MLVSGTQLHEWSWILSLGYTKVKHALNHHWCKNSSSCFKLCDVQSFDLIVKNSVHIVLFCIPYKNAEIFWNKIVSIRMFSMSFALHFALATSEWRLQVHGSYVCHICIAQWVNKYKPLSILDRTLILAWDYQGSLIASCYSKDSLNYHH